MPNTTAVGIDTHSFVKKLMAAGFDEKQAEAQMEAISSVLYEFQNKQLDNLTTKDDLLRMETGRQGGLEGVKTDINHLHGNLGEALT